MSVSTYPVHLTLVQPERHPYDRVQSTRARTRRSPARRKLVLTDIDGDLHHILSVLAQDAGLDANAYAGSLLTDAIKRAAGVYLAAVVDGESR